MTKEQQKIILGEFYAEKKNVMKLKSEDYANEDVLSNFKSAGENIGISAELQCLSLIATKVARLGNLFSGKKPNNESVSDSILDLSNYTDLLYCLVNEQITDKVESIVKQRKDKFNENLVNEIAKLSKAMGGKKNTNPECECTEIPTEYKPTYEAKTKRWDNIAPHPMFDVIGNLNKTIQAGAEWHKKRRESEAQENIDAFEKSEPITDEVNSELKKQEKNKLLETKLNDLLNEKYKQYEETHEPIKEPYEPKVGDRFEDENGIILNVKKVTEEFVVFKYKYNGDLMIAVSWSSDFLDKIKSGTLTKIN